MITLQEFCTYLTTLLNSDSIEDYCPNGIQVEGKQRIRSIATAVSASKTTIEKAVAEGVDLLLVHHGMLWKRDPLPICGIKREKLKLLIEHEITLMSYHLPLDMHNDYGNNWNAAKDFGWSDLTPFGIYNNNAIGVQGTFKPISRELFQQKLEAYYGSTAHVALGGKQIVSSAALVSGGAHDLIESAIKAGVDCFITGSFDEYVWNIAHEENINFYALGHTATERIGPRALGNHLSKHFGIAHNFIDTENPF